MENGDSAGMGIREDSRQRISTVDGDDALYTVPEVYAEDAGA